MSRTDWPTYFIDMAHLVATRATCPRRAVGAVLVQNHRVRATGYNGSPPSQPHCSDVGCHMIDGHCKRTIHAEINALLQVAPHQREGAVLYVTDTPCYECSRTIAGSGIAEVVYDREYRPDAIEELLRLAEIGLRQHGHD